LLFSATNITDVIFKSLAAIAWAYGAAYSE